MSDLYEDHNLSDDEVARYGRQMIAADFDVGRKLQIPFQFQCFQYHVLDQEKLKHAAVLIVGCGGLGNPVALYLAGAGIGKLGLVDFDSVDISNLHRQIAFTTDKVGKRKTEALRDAIAE